jgi:putative Ca2+/H+ antiporter (TMEM165/GDT1 family)
MDLRLFATVFGSMFVAELGDKTQLAMLMFASKSGSHKPTIFLASVAALTLTSAIGVLAGTFMSHHVSEKALSWVAGLGFIVIGIWTIAKG